MHATQVGKYSVLHNGDWSGDVELYDDTARKVVAVLTGESLVALARVIVGRDVIGILEREGYG